MLIQIHIIIIEIWIMITFLPIKEAIAINVEPHCLSYYSTIDETALAQRIEFLLQGLPLSKLLCLRPIKDALAD